MKGLHLLALALIAFFAYHAIQHYRHPEASTADESKQMEVTVPSSPSPELPPPGNVATLKAEPPITASATPIPVVAATPVARPAAPHEKTPAEVNAELLRKYGNQQR